MPEVRNDKEFLDLHGLERFWNNVKDYLDMGAYTVPAGKQVASVRQDHGRLVVTFEAFGGATGEAKEAARESLGVSSSEEVEEALAGKTDLVDGAVEGNLAALDAGGNLADSGVDPETLKRVQEAWSAEPDSALYTLGSIGQDANGVVSVTFVRIPDATVSSSGLMSSEDKGKLDGLPDEAELEGLLEGKADRVEDAVEGDIAVLDSEGNLADSGYSVVDTAGEGFEDNVPTGGAVLEAIGDAVAELDSTGIGSSTHVTVSVVQADGVITDVSVSDTAAAADHVHGNISNDGKVGSDSGKYLVTGENGVVEAGDLPVASTSAAGIVQLSSAIDSTDETMAATPKAVKDAIIAAEQATVSGLDATNSVPAGYYITEVNETDGIVSITTAAMDTAPSVDSTKPVTSGGVQTAIHNEQIARDAFDTWVNSLIPGDATAQNKLADKAYVDDLGTRLEARYLSYNAAEMPFPTYEDFYHADTGTYGPFFYHGGQVLPDNNDVIVITADSTHPNVLGEPATTRWRYFGDDGTGEWRYEYTINNTALNREQLDAINSTITREKVVIYTAHLGKYDNPHNVTKEQVGLGNVENTADLDKPISTATQSALDEKLDKIQNTTSDDHDHIVVLGADGVSLADSGAVITSTYDDDDTVNPVTGSAITEALGGLDFAEVGGAGYYISKVKQEDGTITATATAMDAVPTAGSTNAITSGAVKQEVDTIYISLGGKADKDADAAAGNIAEFDANGNPVDSGHALSEYKTKQGAITVNPESSTNSLTFLTSFEQNANGEITNASAATIPDASTSFKGVVQLTDSTSTTSSTLAATATAVKEAYDHAGSLVESLDSTITGTSTNVDVQVVEESGLITGVSVTDRTPTAIANAIEALDATVRTDISETGTAQSRNIDLTITQADGVLTGITVNRDDSVNAGDLASAISTAVGNMDATVRTDISETGTADNRNIDLTVTQVDGVLTGINVNRDETENRNNKVSSFQATPDDTHYPSEKLVKDSLDLKANKSEMTVTPGSGADTDKTTIQLKNGTTATVLVSHQDITGKADKVSGATDGNFAGLDSHGNLTDSGSKASDFAISGHSHGNISNDGKVGSTANLSVVTTTGGEVTTADLTTADVAASGTTLTAVTSVTQDSKGKISVEKKTIQDGTTAQKGVVQLSSATDSDLETVAATSKAVKDVMDSVDVLSDDKADKVSNATEGNFAGLDYEGNLTDSGKKASDFKTKQSAVSDPTASGNAISFIDTISQDTNGVITPTKKTVSLSSAVDSDAEDAAATPKAVKLAYEHADSVVANLDSEVESNDGTNVQVKVTQVAGEITAVNITTDNTESTGNKVSSWSSTVNDTNYPTEKLVKDGLDAKANKSEMTVTPGTGANADKTTIQLKTGTSATVLTAHQDITGKADKVSGATAGNLASLDANGNLVDSGVSYIDMQGEFKPRQTAQSDPTASGNALSFIDTIRQDEDGVITATKKTVTVDSTYSSSGTNPVNGKAVAAAIGTLDVSNISGFGAGKTLATLTETDGKIAATFQDIEITKSQVSDFPTEMTPSSHTHGNITNDGKIGTTADLGIVTGTGGTVTTKDFTQASPTTGSGTTTEFISTVAQGSDGAISATKKAITPASTSTAGIVQLSSSTSSSSETMAATPKAVSDLADTLGSGKADKVSGATAGNFAGLDSNGNLTDSGKKASDFATAAQGSKADTAVQGVKVNGMELTKDSLNKVDITAVTGVKGSSESTYRTGQVSITAGNVGAYTTAEVDAALALKEDAANKKQTVNTSSTTEFPSSAAVAAFVNSSIATATANFLGNYTLTDLGLTYPATNTQIEGALGSYTWPAGVTPTNNDYVIVSINSGTDPDTGEPIIDEYRRFKYDGSVWQYEYTLNNSSFTQAQWEAINSGITDTDKSAYDTHVADTTIHVTDADKTAWNAKYDKPSGGIPSADMTNAVQASLGKADSAIQGVVLNGTTLTPDASKVVDLGDLKTKQTAVPDPTAEGTAINFINSISQDTNGVITATKRTIRPASASQSGVMSASDFSKLAGIESGAEANQNAFSNVKVGNVTVAADSATDTLNLVAGANVQISADASTDTVTVSATDTTYDADRGISLVSGKFGHSNTAVTGASVGPSAAVTGVSVSVPRVTFDNYGHITAASGKTFTVQDGTTSQKGVVQLSSTAGSDEDKAATPKLVSDSVSGKADKVTTATEDNFASFDASGNIKDSGKKASDFKTKQTAKSSPTASGNTLSFIDTISQNTNGEITATKKSVTVDSTYSSTGTNPVNGTAVAAAIGTLDVSDITGFGAGKTLATLIETDGKIAATFQDIEITKSQVSDFSHSHGNITNDGKIGTMANLPVVTGTSGAVTTGAFSTSTVAVGTSSSAGSANTFSRGDHKHSISLTTGDSAGQVKIAGSNVDVKGWGDKADKKVPATAGNLATLDANGNLADSGVSYAGLQGEFKPKQTAVTVTGLGTAKTITAMSQTADGVISVTAGDIRSATTGQTGIVQLNNTVTSTSTTQAATANAVKTAYDHADSIVAGLDVDSVGGVGKYISAISETDGKISATATTMDTAPTANSTNAVTSGGVKTALDAKVNVASILLENQSTTLLSKVQSYAGTENKHYARWYTKSDGGTKLTDLPVSGKCFVCEAICSRWVSASDYVYQLTLWSKEDTNPYVAIVKQSTTAISWSRLNTQTITGVKGEAESSYRTGNVNLTPANLGISATSTSVTVGSTTFNQYVHPTTSGNKHVPSGGSSGQFLGWSADGTATWVNNPNTDTKVKATAKTDNVEYKILATASASPTSGNATEAVYDVDITLNPSTNTIAANISGNAATATKPKTTTLTTSNNLDDIKGSSLGDVLYYSWASGNAPTGATLITGSGDAPTATMEVVRTHSGSYCIQTVYTADKGVYQRVYNNGTWGSWYSYAKSDHVHGHINNNGTITSNGVDLASGDRLAIVDSSDSSLVKKTNISFDGSTVSKALTQKGTFESVMLAADAMSFATGNGLEIATSGTTATLSMNISAIPTETITSLIAGLG